DEPERVAEAMQEALRRFPAGVYALWHPISARVDLGPVFRSLRARRAPPVWSGRLTVAPRAEGLRGSGLVVVNPPWKFESEASAVLAYLGRTLAGAADRPDETDWIVPEARPGAAP
ncbi:MAG: 23S rRNA (adenine(2030)-N(6))-methyltransferase RlmJ, partial [Opitutaceae bacterium]